MENLCGTECNSTKSCKLDSCTPGVLPVVIGAPNTAISIDTETTSISSSDGEEWPSDLVPVSNDIGTGANAATITVESSTDVVIGPLTQFHGPVTIYQNVSSNTHPSELGRCKLEGVPNPQKTFEDNNVQKLTIDTLLKPKAYKWILLLSLFLTGIGILTAITVISSFKIDTFDEKLEIVKNQSNTNENETVPLDFPHRMYTRTDWNGRPSLNFTKPLKHPTEYVIVSHTGGSFCADFPDCANKIRNMQDYHMQTKKSPDIGYNFLIGGDGDIYIGRGWDIQNFHRDKNIGVSIIGDYRVKDIMTPRMISALKELLGLGVKLEKLATDYKVVCHNQTSATLSPGENVCREVAKLPHYYPGFVKIDK